MTFFEKMTLQSLKIIHIVFRQTMLIIAITPLLAILLNFLQVMVWSFERANFIP